MSHLKETHIVENESEAMLQAKPQTASDAVRKHSRCPACDSHLHFNHFADFRSNQTREVAKCPECGIRVREVLHSLQ